MKFENSDIRVVWIDLDDTLVDFRTNSRRALRRLFDTQNLAPLFGTPGHWTECYETYNHALWDKYNRALITREQLRTDRFAMPLQEAGVPEMEAIELSARFDPLYLDFLAREKALVPGAIALLERLRTEGVTIGILSNGFKEVQFKKLDNTGLMPYIDIVVLSDDIGVNKPDIRLYRHAMERTGISDPEAHLMIGDNPSTDIAGALAAGWHAMLLSDTPAPAQPCFTAPTLHEIMLKIVRE